MLYFIFYCIFSCSEHKSGRVRLGAGEDIRGGHVRLGARSSWHEEGCLGARLQGHEVGALCPCTGILLILADQSMHTQRSLQGHDLLQCAELRVFLDGENDIEALCARDEVRGTRPPRTCRSMCAPRLCRLDAGLLHDVLLFDAGTRPL